MTDQVKAAREDLAFLKAVAEDKGPLPALFGAGLLAAGLIYGVNLIYIWFGVTGHAPWRAEWLMFSWLPGTVFYLPTQIAISWRSRGISFGPSARVFGAAWTAMGLMTLSIVAVIAIGSYTARINFSVLWPSIAIALYGGAWAVVAMIRKSLPTFLVAVACFGTAAYCATLINSNNLWLAMGLAVLAFFAVPGAVIWKMARR